MPDVAGLRPTGDRVRETVFNWLQPLIAGSHCLDLFAGTGALGFESLSRYAESVTFVEPNATAFGQLNGSLRILDHPGADVQQCTAEQFLAQNTRLFDIVFVDPPFELDVQWQVLGALTERHLSASACVYVETPSRQPPPAEWPPGCRLHREKQLGDVCARLFMIDETV